MRIKTLVQKSIRQLLGDQDSFYIIPDYQRPYEWEKNHVRRLWDDVIRSYNNETSDGYFLGTLIVVPNGDSYDVVDGQQRLITLTMLLAVFRDHFHALGMKDRAIEIGSEFIKKGTRHRVAVQPDQSFEMDENVLKPGSTNTDEASYGRFATNAGVFRSALDAEIRVRLLDDKGAAVFLEKLYLHLAAKIEVIFVVVDDLSSAYTIFETINDTGLGLRQDDLMKNYLLSRLASEIKATDAIGQQHDFETAKKSLLSQWIEMRKYRESDAQWMENLLKWHLNAAHGIKPKAKLFVELRNQMDAKQQDAASFVSDVMVTYNAHRSFTDVNHSYYLALKGRVRALLRLMEQLNSTEWIPILIAARRQNMSADDFSNVVEAVERLFALYWIAGFSSQKMRLISLNLIRLIGRGAVAARMGCETWIREPYNGVRERFFEAVGGECYGMDWCRYVLARYEHSLSDNSTFQFDESLQVEHVLPRSPRDEYWSERFETKQAKALANRLGNLTLLVGGKDGGKNQSASNRPFPAKREVYCPKDGKVTAFLMAREVCEENEWTPAVIERRQKKMIAKLSGKYVWDISASTSDSPVTFTADELKRLSAIVGVLGDRLGVRFQSWMEGKWQEEEDGRVTSSAYYVIDGENWVSIGIWKTLVFSNEPETFVFVDMSFDEEKMIARVASHPKFVDWYVDSWGVQKRVDLNDGEKVIALLADAYQVWLEVVPKYENMKAPLNKTTGIAKKIVANCSRGENTLIQSGSEFQIMSGLIANWFLWSGWYHSVDEAMKHIGENRQTLDSINRYSKEEEWEIVDWPKA